MKKYIIIIESVVILGLGVMVLNPPKVEQLEPVTETILEVVTEQSEPVFVDRIVVDKVVEIKEVPVEKIVEKIVEVEVIKTVELPVYNEKIVYRDREVPVYETIYKDVPVDRIVYQTREVEKIVYKECQVDNSLKAQKLAELEKIDQKIIQTKRDRNEDIENACSPGMTVSFCGGSQTRIRNDYQKIIDNLNLDHQEIVNWLNYN